VNPLIDTAELERFLQSRNVKILDATYGEGPSPQGIPGARDFDIDDIADTSSPLPHTAPSPEKFEEKMRGLGINAGDIVVVYDRHGFHMAAARAWWMFRLFGHDDVRVLNGGLKSWSEEGRALVQKPQGPPPRGNFCAGFRPHLIKHIDDIRRGGFTLLDARSAERFEGTAPDPRPNIKSGHIPGSKNLPYASLIDIKGKMKSEKELAALLKDLPAGDIACTCGSGVTACVIALALYALGREDAAVYDGSWIEWTLTGGDVAHGAK